MADDDKFRLAVIAGASHALKYREENPRATDQETLKHITEKTEFILRNMESED